MFKCQDLRTCWNRLHWFLEVWSYLQHFIKHVSQTMFAFWQVTWDFHPHIFFPFWMTQATRQQRTEKLQWNNKELRVRLRRFDSRRISIFRGGGSASSRLQKTICTFSFQITGGADFLKSLAVFWQLSLISRCYLVVSEQGEQVLDQDSSVCMPSVRRQKDTTTLKAMRTLLH